MRITITMDDRLASEARDLAGDNMSAWIASLVRREVLREAITAEQDFDRANPASADNRDLLIAENEARLADAA
jgi:hypothetical protein